MSSEISQPGSASPQAPTWKEKLLALFFITCMIAIIVFIFGLFRGESGGDDCLPLDSSSDPACQEMYRNFREDYWENYEIVP